MSLRRSIRPRRAPARDQGIEFVVSDLPQPGDEDSEDADFEAPNEAAKDQDDEAEAAYEGSGNPDDDAQKSKPSRGSRKPKTVPKAPAKPPRRKKRLRATRPENFHTIPPYPIDVRGTRIYAGHLKRWDRFRVLIDIMYGPSIRGIDLMNAMRNRWLNHPILPAKSNVSEGGVLPSPWLPNGFESEQEARLRTWFERYRSTGPGVQTSRSLSSQEAVHYVPQSQQGLAVFSGPAAAQEEFHLAQGKEPVALGSSGVSLGRSDSPGEHPEVWMFDIGGLVISMGWAPLPGHTEQLLALAVIPHADQAESSGPRNIPKEKKKKTAGSIQFWNVKFEQDEEGVARLARQPPEFSLALCFDWGRPRRLAWCPIVLHSSSLHGLLATLHTDGKVRIIEVPKVESARSDYLESPIATIGITDEYNVDATCMSWCGVNRIVLGHSDGSISLWSIQPTMMLNRLPVHHNTILDIASAYPSKPYMISSNPVGGNCKIIDLSRPSSEQSYITVAITHFQTHLHTWSDHLQGFIAAYPSGNPGNTALACLHARYYPSPRTVFTGYSQPICCSIGASHPYLLVGHPDGSLWSSNAIRKLLYDRGEPVSKVKLFEHEFSPVPPGTVQEPGINGVRGAVRFLQGFEPEANEHPRAERMRQMMKNKRAKETKQKKKRAKGDEDEDEDEDEDVDDLAAEEDEGLQEKTPRKAAEEPDKKTIADRSKYVIHEPLTRVTDVCWNPNLEFGWWAAAAMGSGIVRIMDLGVDT